MFAGRCKMKSSMNGKSRDVSAGRRIFPSISHFYKEIGEQISTANDGIESIVLLNIEIDNLEFVLRSFGPVKRNEIINKVGEIIHASMDTDARLYHISQFRFAMLLFDTRFKRAVNLTKKLIAKLEKSTNINGIDFDIDIKIGISHYPNHAEDIYELVRTAAFACYIARKTHSDYATYEAKLDEWENYQMQLLTDIRTSLENQNDIRLALQPIVNLTNGNCEKVEGLCRWTHPELGPIAPGDFLPYVEQSPLIFNLTENTLELGLELLAGFSESENPCNIAINLSAKVFKNPNLLDLIKEQLNFFNIDMEKLIFEITETNIMEHPKGSVKFLKSLKDLGCKIAIDDFGTGHSSLAYIADLPIDIIKIDQCFIREIHRPQNQAIICAAVSLADKLNLETVAEGIEDSRQYEKCCDLGIKYGQGYFIGKPMDSDDFQSWYLANTVSRHQAKATPLFNNLEK